MIKRKKIVSTSYIAFALVILLALTVSLLSKWLIERELKISLTERYSSEQAETARQTAYDLERTVDTVKDKLELIARIENIKSLDSKTCNTEIHEIISSIGSSLGNLGRLNPEGVFYCSYNKKLLGRKGSDLGTYVTDIFNDPQHRPVMSRMILPEGSDSYVLAVHVPVYDKNHKFIGTLGGAISAKKMAEDFLGKVVIGQTGFVSVVDDNGDIIYNKDLSLIGKNRNSDEIQELTHHNDVLNQAFEDAKQGKSSKVSYFVGKEERFGVISSIEVLPGRRWIVSGVIPTEEINTGVKQLGVNKMIGLIVTAYGLVMFGAIVYLAMYVHKRVNADSDN